MMEKGKYYLNNYRPISLLPIFGKVFENVIYNNLFTYFHKNKFLSVNQSGFRSCSQLFAKSLLKIECIQKRALRFLYNDHESTYEELRTKANRNYMNIYRLKILCTEIYKTINDLNPGYMKNIFQRYDTDRPVRSQHLNNLKVPRVNQETFGTNSLTSLGPKIWNNLSIHLKCSDNLISFKEMIKNWDGRNCKCNICNAHISRI